MKEPTRFYRNWHKGKDLEYFQVMIKDSDLDIGIDKKSYSKEIERWCLQELIRLRKELEDYIALDANFKSSLKPVKLLPAAPPVACVMSEAALVAGVGPMAAVAGAFADFIGQGLKGRVKQVVVENGGDIYLDGDRERVVAVYAGDSPFTNKIGILVKPKEYPVGICTSSGTVGPALSFGEADAAIIKATSAALADAAATAIGNLVKTPEDFETAINEAKKIPNLKGALIIKGGKMILWGEMEIVPI